MEDFDGGNSRGGWVFGDLWRHIYYVIDAAVVGINPGTPGVEEETVGHHVTNGKSVNRVVLRNDFRSLWVIIYDTI